MTTVADSRLRDAPVVPSRPLLASGLGAAAGFVALTVLTTQIRLFPGERATAAWIARRAEPWLGGIATALDELFTDASATLVFVVLVPLVRWAWGRGEAVALLLAGAATGATRFAAIVERPRPTGALEWGSVRLGEGGYPSGHVVYMVLIGGTIAAAAWRTRRKGQQLLALAIGALVAITGLSRVLVLDHWPVDVIGGWLFGWAALVAVVWIRAAWLPWTWSADGRFGPQQ